jgi:hypothetical protein
VTASRVKAGDDAESENEVSADTRGNAARQIRVSCAVFVFGPERKASSREKDKHCCVTKTQINLTIGCAQR